LRFDANHGSVEAAGLSQLEQSRLKGEHSADEWAALLSLRMDRDPQQGKSLAIVGKYQVVNDRLIFTPRYPLIEGKRYRATFDPSVLHRADQKQASVELVFTMAEKEIGKPAEVVEVYPTSNVVPENQLKLYLTFSKSMSRGEVYRRVKLLDAQGKPVERPFIELLEELWNADNTRLTLLFDPGRIKRGLKPREEEGPILEDGKTYTFVIDSAWPDADGQPLATSFRKTFRAVAPDNVQPTPGTWLIEPVKPGSRAALKLRFPESLDRAMLDRSIRVGVNGRAEIEKGKITISDQERSWSFVPDQPWPLGDIQLRINPELEDLAGNSVARPFEVDAVRTGSVPNSRVEVIVPVPSTP
jgi:hypothetical protein